MATSSNSRSGASTSNAQDKSQSRPLAGRPSLTTDNDFEYDHPSQSSSKPGSKQGKPSDRTSAYNTYDEYFESSRDSVAAFGVGMGLLGEISESEDDSDDDVLPVRRIPAPKAAAAKPQISGSAEAAGSGKNQALFQNTRESATKPAASAERAPEKPAATTYPPRPKLTALNVGAPLTNSEPLPTLSRSPPVNGPSRVPSQRSQAEPPYRPAQPPQVAALREPPRAAQARSPSPLDRAENNRSPIPGSPARYVASPEPVRPYPTNARGPSPAPVFPQPSSPLQIPSTAPLDLPMSNPITPMFIAPPQQPAIDAKKAVPATLIMRGDHEGLLLERTPKHERVQFETKLSQSVSSSAELGSEESGTSTLVGEGVPPVPRVKKSAYARKEGDDFWRRFSTVAHETEKRPEGRSSSWLIRTQSRSRSASRWVWVLGIVTIILIAGGVTVALKFSKNNPAHGDPKTIGGSGGQGKALSTTSAHASSAATTAFSIATFADNDIAVETRTSAVPSLPLPTSTTALAFPSPSFTSAPSKKKMVRKHRRIEVSQQRTPSFQ